MNLLQGVCIFLGAVAIALVIMILILTALLHNVQVENRAAREHITGLQADNALLIEDKRELTRQNEQLQERNDILAAMAKELTSREVIEVQCDDEQPVLYYEQETKRYVGLPEITWSFNRLPDAHTNTYRCEDYRLFARGTEQYQIQQKAFTEPETGLRHVIIGGEQYYTVALASAYGITLGNAWRVTLRNGSQFNILHGDYKHPIMQARADDFGDADVNYDEQDTVSVIEFIYDEQAMPRKAKLAGTASYFEQFGGMYGDGGDIVKIEYLGRKWKP